MNRTVFYSWQSDLPNPTNRGFIQKALEKAIKQVSLDKGTIVIDRDTAGVGGSPDISKTIFDKISKADVLVADVSIINHGSKFKKTPNPNVLIELGYAIRALTLSNIITIINIKYGSPDNLPFDLKMKRVVTYDSSKDKTAEIEALASKIKYQLELIFSENRAKEDIQAGIIEVIKQQKVERISHIKSYMKTFCTDLEAFYPGDGMLTPGVTDPEYDQKIIDALDKTIGLIADFRSVIETISTYNDLDAQKVIFNGFKPIIENYNHKKDYSGGISHKAKFDYFKFIGNELFVIMTSILLREQNWELLKYILEEQIVISNSDNHNRPKAVSFTYFSQDLFCFYYRKQRLKSNRHDLHYDMLIQRRRSEVDSTPDAVEEYTSADLLLFIKSESMNLIDSTDVVFSWRPQSLLFFELPGFILLSKSKAYAKNIINVLNLSSIQDFKVLLNNKLPGLSRQYSGLPLIWRNPVEGDYIEEIGMN